MSGKIINIHAREILDSRGNPTVEVELSDGIRVARASVPSGASTGSFEALELRDGGKRFNGRGVQKAVDNINKKISPKIKYFGLGNQEKFDRFLIELDGSKNKKNIGANAILGLSVAYAKLSAEVKNIPLYEYFSLVCGCDRPKAPRLMFNVINGGAHAPGALDIQEYMVIPEVKSVKKSIQIASEIYHSLKQYLKKEFGPLAANVGDEGGFVPPIKKDNEKPFKILTEVIKKLGYEKIIKFGIDAAASEFYNLKTKKYKFEGEEITADKLSDFYKKIARKYPLVYLEDPFEENDFENFAKLNGNLKKISSKVLVSGDDLTVTNVSRMEIAVKKNSCGAMIVKPNQIGTVLEAMEAARFAKKNGWQPVASHRSGETEDIFIADFAFGIGAWGIKAGAPARGERVAKYNQFLRIEENYF